MRNVFDRIEDAPPPSKELRDIYIETSEDGFLCLIHYIDRDGKWLLAGRVYPAEMD